MRERVLAVCMEVDDSIDYSATNLIDGDLLDSLSLVEIVTALMEEFEVDIPYEDIVPENFNSIDAMKELVERYV
ncbi:MAG: phosphopantetheine-binding protein [Eubacteriales bacterium]